MTTKRIIVVIEHVDAQREPPTPVQAIMHQRAKDQFLRYQSCLYLVWYQLAIGAALCLGHASDPKNVILAVLFVGLWEAGLNGLVYLARRQDVIR